MTLDGTKKDHAMSLDVPTQMVGDHPLSQYMCSMFIEPIE